MDSNGHIPLIVQNSCCGQNAPRACALLQQAKDQDMRVALAQTIPSGTVLHKVFLRNLSDPTAEEIGTLVTEGPMVASKFGDASLFFKHMRKQQL